jgi:hypothetical protein
MRTKPGTQETLRWPASEVYGVSRSSKGVQTASAKSMMRQRSQNQLSRAVTGAGRNWPDKSPAFRNHRLVLAPVARTKTPDLWKCALVRAVPVQKALGLSATDN